MLLEVLVDLHTAARVPDCVDRRVEGPHELLRLSEALVTQCHGGVYDVLAITTHHHKPGGGRRVVRCVCVCVCVYVCVCVRVVIRWNVVYYVSGVCHVRARCIILEYGAAC